MTRPMFRQEALEQLSSPERLDQLMHLVSPKDWLVVAAFAAIVGLALVWSAFGHLPTTVTGRGVLIRPRKVVHLQAPAAGRLMSFSGRVGDVLQAGDRLGVIDQADLRQQLQEERFKLQSLLAQDASKRSLQSQQTSLHTQQTQLEKHAIELERQDLRQRLRDAERQTPILIQRVESRHRLEKLGLAPRHSDDRLRAEQAQLANQDKIAALRAQLQQLAGQLKQLASREKRVALETLEASTSRHNDMQEVQSRITLYEGELDRNSQIISKHHGRLLEVTVNAGQMIEAGMRLGSIEVEDPSTTLVGLTYFPIKAGKKIEPGMTIQIAPDTVARERFGSMVGVVRSVSAFPVTKAGITSLVGNPEVVEALLTQGPSIEVFADLNANPATFSQYQWSSSHGPALRMTSGTTMTGRVVVEQRAPITYVLPLLRETIGWY